MTFAVLLSAFGYFVDVYDLLLFSIVRVSSLKSIGVPDTELMKSGILLINLQMLGILLGGWFWGVLGDRYGRKSILLGSILIYSLANLANAFVHDMGTYSVLRFCAGFGLAGELGAAITLIAESLPTSRRTNGAMIIAAIGMMGAVAAGVFSEIFDWRTCYAIGGVMGLVLLFGRNSVKESPLFQRQASRGKIRLGTYLMCVAVGLPLWFTSGLLISFAPEFTRALGVVGEVSVGRGILICYGAASIGDILAAIISKRLKSRKITIALFMLGTWTASIIYLWVPGLTSAQVYWLFALMGVAGGYWATYVLFASEQFGTNVRATVTVSIPNMVRAGVLIMTTVFQSLATGQGVVRAASGVGLAVMVISVVCLLPLQETFSRDLDFQD